MCALKLFLLGSPRIECDGALVAIKRRRGLALLAYLAVAGQLQRRDALTELLWPESAQNAARQALRRDLSELNLALGGQWLEADRETVGLRSGFWLDLHQFQRHLDACAAAPDACLPHLIEAVALYRDDFLAGFTLSDSPTFDEWQSFHTETLRQACAAALERLAQVLANQGDPEAAIPHARRWLSLDSLHEPAHRQLMQLYAHANQPAAALRQYERCREILNDELGIPPAPETTTLYEQIRERKARSVPAVTTPRPATARLPRHNLPTQTTPFIGRERELADIRRLLLDEPDCRLLNLFGSGGIGKTRLALTAATETLDAFPDGVYLVSLASVGEAAFIAPAIAEALRFTFYGQGDPKDQLLDYLSQKRLLLVIDNFEHLLAGADLLSAIVSRAPSVTMLATSRERLHLQEEWVYEVPGLPFPAVIDAASEVLDTYDAVRLFVQRARQTKAGFTPSADEMADIGRICQLVEGMPLGLELAAPWIRTLSCGEIAAEIAHSLDFLTTAHRNVLERHRSLRVVFEQAWGRLSQAEQSVPMRLSVFRGGCTREAAEAVAGATLPVLSSLVDKALLHRTNLGRYELHELIRQFADEKLRESGEDREMRRKHALAYLALAQIAQPYLHGGEQKYWLDRLECEHDNFRAVLRWSQDGIGDPDIGLRLLAALWQFWWMRGHINEGRRWFEELLRMIGLDTASAVRGWALLGAGMLGRDYSGGYRDYWQTAGRRLEEALTQFRAAGDDAGIALSLCELGAIARIQSDFTRAQSLVEEGLRISRRQDTPSWITAHILFRLGNLIYRQADLPRATALYEECLAIAHHLGDSQIAAAALIRLADVTGAQLDFVRAAKFAEDALFVARKAGDTLNELAALRQLADELKFMGELDHAGALVKEMHSLALAHDIRDAAGMALTMLGLIAREQDNSKRADSLFRESIVWYRDKLGIWGNWWNVLGLATLATTEEESKRAAQLYGALDAWQKDCNLLCFPHNQRQFGTYMDATRAQLGVATYDGIFEEGRAMTTEQAFQYALAND